MPFLQTSVVLDSSHDMPLTPTAAEDDKVKDDEDKDIREKVSKVPKEVACRTVLPPKADPIDDPDANPKWIAAMLKARCELSVTAEVVMMWSGRCTELAQMSQK